MRALFNKHAITHIYTLLLVQHLHFNQLKADAIQQHCQWHAAVR